jgi:hypothetical protein
VGDGDSIDKSQFVQIASKSWMTYREGKNHLCSFRGILWQDYHHGQLNLAGQGMQLMHVRVDGSQHTLYVLLRLLSTETTHIPSFLTEKF